jgi:hypothetical protein
MKTDTRKYVAAAVALVTVLGIAVHDTKIDSLTRFALAIPVFAIAYEGASMLAMLGLSGDAHTHVERVSVERSADRNTSLMPKTPTRHNEDKKYRMQKRVPRGHQAFDNYYMPLFS